MKKVLSTILIAAIVVSSAIGVTAAISKTATLEHAFNIPTIAASTAVEEKTTSVESDSSQEQLVMPQLNNLYQNTITPSHRSIEVTNQCGNTLDLTITSSNEDFSKIATADVTVTLDNVYDVGFVNGEGSFEYTDSFGNSGTGNVTVSKNVIFLEINEEYNCSSPWSIANATGKYI